MQRETLLRLIAYVSVVVAVIFFAVRGNHRTALPALNSANNATIVNTVSSTAKTPKSASKVSLPGKFAVEKDAQPLPIGRKAMREEAHVSGAGMGKRDSKPEKRIVQHNANSYDSRLPRISELLHLLRIDPEQLAADRGKYSTNEVYTGWLGRVHSILGNELSKEQLATISEDQLSYLYISDRLDEEYLNGRIDHKTYTDQLAKLLQFSQATYTDILDDDKYKLLFDVSRSDTNHLIDATIRAIPEFEILNPNTSAEDASHIIPDSKRKQLNKIFRKRELAAREIAHRLDTGELSTDDIDIAFQQSFQEYIDAAKRILTSEEYDIVFGTELTEATQ